MWYLDQPVEMYVPKLLRTAWKAKVVGIQPGVIVVQYTGLDGITETYAFNRETLRGLLLKWLALRVDESAIPPTPLFEVTL